VVRNHDIYIYDYNSVNPPIIIPSCSDVVIVLDFRTYTSDLRMANREKAKNIHKMALIHHDCIDNSAYNLGNVIGHAIFNCIDSFFSIS